MSRPEAAQRPLLPRIGGWLERAFGALMVAGLGVVLGMMYMKPDKRVLSVSAAVIVTGIAWRLDFVSGVGLLVLALPFPKGTTFGSTNLAFIALLAIIYLLRISQREVPQPRPTAIDGPIVALVVSYVISFYNVVNYSFAFPLFFLFIGTVILFYLVVNCVRSERDLERLHMIQSVATLFILLLAVYELNHPGASIVPGWIEFGASNMGEDFNRRNVRIGSIFMDYELLADFCALNLLFFFFQLSRGGSTLRRSFFGGMIGLSLLVMFSTVTRGPIFSLAIAVAFLLWLTRRHLRIVPMMIGAAVISAAFVGMNFFVANFTRSGDLFGRLGQTTFVGGVPDSRSGIWQEAIQRWAMHPLIGWGPYYAHEHGLVQWYWPHNLYLYVANIIGVVGLAFYLWLLFKLWRVTSPRVDTLSSPSYVESYLLIAHVQLAFFLIDQFKIEYLRNNVYQYQVWLMFALWVAASRLVKDGSAPAAAPSPVAAR